MRAAFSLLAPWSLSASYCSGSLTLGPGVFCPGMPSGYPVSTRRDQGANAARTRVAPPAERVAVRRDLDARIAGLDAGAGEREDRAVHAGRGAAHRAHPSVADPGDHGLARRAHRDRG